MRFVGNQDVPGDRLERMQDLRPLDEVERHDANTRNRPRIQTARE